MKDHYQTLELAPGASREEIKKSFRRLAHEFHPDKNPSNTFAAARFRELHEAYTVLSNEEKRALYDYERWLSGRFSRPAAAITPGSLLQEVRKLNAHLAEVDVYRMNKQLLHEYLIFLLGDEKIAILQQRATEEVIDAVADELVKATHPLPFYYAREVLQRLRELAGGHPDILNRLERHLDRVTREDRRQKLFPWLALLITLLLCVAMYFFAKR